MASRVKIIGLGQKFIRTQLVTIKEFSDRQIEAIAKETERVIQREIITRSDKREGATGKLANSFFAFPITDGWGVGDIDFLNQNAKYWYWQNFGVAQTGRTTPPNSRGAFNTGNPAPVEGGGNSRWNQSSTGQFMIRPTKAIEAKNYIQATINQVNQIVASVVSRIRL